MIKLKQFLMSAIIVCGCGFLTNLNSSTLAMDNPVPADDSSSLALINESVSQVPADESSSLAPINESVSQIPANENSAIVYAPKSTADECVISSNYYSFKNLDGLVFALGDHTTDSRKFYRINYVKDKITVHYNGDDDNRNKNKKNVYEMQFFGNCKGKFGKYSEDKHLKEMRITAHRLESKYGKKIGEYKLDNTYMYRGYYNNDPEQEYIGLCIPYDLPEGFYDFNFYCEDMSSTYFLSIPITKEKEYDINYN